MEDLSEADLRSVERMIRGLRLLEEQEPAPLTAEERRARIYAIAGEYADVLPTVDEFLAEKHQEKAREDARWARWTEENP